MTDSLRVGHISDLHLRCHLPGTSAVASRRSRDMPDLFAEALVGLVAAGVDVVVVTGDLIDHPYPLQDTGDSEGAGVADLRLVAEALRELSCPWSVLPGNHDHPRLFGDVFGQQPRDFDVKGTRFVAFHDWDRPLPSAAEDEEMANVPRRVAAERRRFDAILGDGDPRPQIHLQHYVITPRLDEGWPHTYGDGELLGDALVQDERVRLALSGHYHPGVESFRQGEVGGGTWFSVAPAFCEPPHAYLLHEVRQDGSLTTARVDLRPNPERRP